jgi:hypothetical protein
MDRISVNVCTRVTLFALVAVGMLDSSVHAFACQ